MKRSCVAIVDAARARIYAYEPACARTADGGGMSAAAPGTPEPALDLLVNLLVNPHRARGDPSAAQPEILRGAARSGAPAVECDEHAGEVEHDADHEIDHEIDHDADRFAEQVIAAIDRFAREQACERVLVVASPELLGALRAAGDASRRTAPAPAIEYVARDLARLTSPQIHDRDDDLRLVAARAQSAFARG